MQVVLLQDVKNVGRKWEVRDVADGFARNVLIPNQQAAPATPAMLERAKSEQAKQTKSVEEVARERNQKANILDGVVITVSAKANDKGELYAAVSPAQIVKAIKTQQRIRVSPKAIKTKQPVKQVGAHRVMVKLGSGSEAECTLQVENT